MFISYSAQLTLYSCLFYPGPNQRVNESTLVTYQSSLTHWARWWYCTVIRESLPANNLTDSHCTNRDGREHCRCSIAISYETRYDLCERLISAVRQHTSVFDSCEFLSIKNTVCLISYLCLSVSFLSESSLNQLSELVSGKMITGRCVMFLCKNIRALHNQLSHSSYGKYKNVC